MMKSMPATTLRRVKNGFMPISVPSTTNHSQLPPFLQHQPLQQMALLIRSILHHATEPFLRRSRMRFKSILSSLVRVLIAVIHCDGGPLAVRNSPTFLGLQEIFFQFLVNSTDFFFLFDHLLTFLAFSLQDLPSRLNGFFQEAVIRYHFAVHASAQRPSGL
jgi:hypothetical protein